jgi:F420-dependent oxidoreductase-like protein
MASVRFGVQTPQQNVAWPELVSFWRFLDRHTRFDSIWTMDHLVPPNDETDNRDPCFESYTTLAAAAQITDRVRLGCLVTANTFRHPALLAKMAATIDHISAGRLNLALGAGWNEFEHQAYGIPLPSLRERQDRLEEAAQVLRLFFAAEEPVSFDGRHYRLKDAPFAPGFVQKPHPPLWIGGGGEKRTLRTVARYADVANLLGPVSVVRHKLEVLRSHCDAVGRDYDSIEKTVHVPVFVHERPEIIAGIAPLLARHQQISVETLLEETPVGPASRVCEIVGRYAELGITAIVFPVVAPYDADGMRHLSEAVAAEFA